MIEHINMAFPLKQDDIESLFSEQEEVDDEIIFIFQGYGNSTLDPDFEYELDTENLLHSCHTYFCFSLKTYHEEEDNEAQKKSSLREISFRLFGVETSHKAQITSPPSHKRPPLPLIQASILLDKYEWLINVIAYMDTWAAKTIMNPYILPLEYWEPNHTYLCAAYGNTFLDRLIPKQKIGI